MKGVRFGLMDSSSFFIIGTASHLDHVFTFSEFDICYFYLLYFGSDFEILFWTENLFSCYTRKIRQSDFVASKKLAGEVQTRIQMDTR